MMINQELIKPISSFNSGYTCLEEMLTLFFFITSERHIKNICSLLFLVFDSLHLLFSYSDVQELKYLQILVFKSTGQVGAKKGAMNKCSVLNKEQCQVFYALYINGKLFMEIS